MSTVDEQIQSAADAGAFMGDDPLQSFLGVGPSLDLHTHFGVAGSLTRVSGSCGVRPWKGPL